MTATAPPATHKVVSVQDPFSGFTTSKDVELVWYDKGLTAENLSPGARELMEGYASIPHDEVTKHIEDMRDKAWKVFPYPCIGQFRFLDVSLNRTPSFTRILSILTSSGDNEPKYLDVGCGMGQNIRWLAHHGKVPPSRLYGAELEGEFIELGYELFRDKERINPPPAGGGEEPQHMFVLDVLARDWGSPLNSPAELKNALDVVHLGKLLHLFTEEEQKEVLRRCVSEMLVKTPGKEHGGAAWIVGSTLGHLVEAPLRMSHERFKDTKRHSAESFARLVDGLGRDESCNQGGKVEIVGRAEYDASENVGWMDEKTRILLFEIEVRRVD